jgi:non-ribosomal peptide synthetase component F
MTQLFDQTFDLSVHDMFACWGSGATLYCPSDSARRIPHQFVRRHELSCWFSTPSTIALLGRLRMLRPDDFPTLRLSLFCGEPLPKRLAGEWLKAAPRSVVENLYGPTETTIAITAFRVPRDLAGLPDIVPIGTALPGQMAVVDAPQGEPGELALGGSQVTAGYWRQDALTEQRFKTRAGHRWYLTGDRAVFDGATLHFLGRLDRQVKIAGHRVELQEIESVLREAAGCDSVAALAWPIDSDGLAQGVVGVVTEESAPDAAMTALLRQRLAPYMVPARFLRLAEWPLNTNGKTDYTLLQTLVSGRP